MQDTPVKEEVSFTQTSSDTNTSNNNKKGESDFFHFGGPNHWDYEYPQMSDKKISELGATKEKCGSLPTQDSEVFKDNKDPKNIIFMLENQKAKQ